MQVLIFEISDSGPKIWCLKKYIKGINQVATSWMPFISPRLSETMGNLWRPKKFVFCLSFGEKRVYTQEKIEVIDDIQIQRQRILQSLEKEVFFFF